MWLVKWSLDRFIIIFFFLFLQIILGNVNVSILNRTAKVQYKDDYEKFKLILNGIGLFMAIINLSFSSRLVHKWGGGGRNICSCMLYRQGKRSLHTIRRHTMDTHIVSDSVCYLFADTKLPIALILFIFNSRLFEYSIIRHSELFNERYA